MQTLQRTSTETNKALSSRNEDFDRIRKVFAERVHTESENGILVEGDSLELLQRIPDHTISLVLTDPPYHATKKANIYGDTAFEEDQHYLDWMALYSKEWKRILRTNGSFFCFCASEMAARLEVMFASDFNILSQIVWTKPNEPGFDGWKQKMKKEALRQWYPHTERIIFAEPACEGNLHRSPFAHFLRETRKKSGLSAHQLAEITGSYGKVNHGGAVSNWETGRNIPSREQYARMCRAFLDTGRISQMPPYEDVIRPFAMDGSKEFTDVWTFPSVKPYKGKHPAEKPLSMLEHAIEATTFSGDIVLDCFAGSGSTARAAIKLGRRSVSFEIDTQWMPAITENLESAEEEKTFLSIDKLQPRTPSKAKPQLPLFLMGK